MTKESPPVNKPLLAIASLTLTLSLSACGSGGNKDAATAADSEVTTSAAAPVSTAPSLSENEKVVKKFVDALDALGIKHSAPKRTEAAAVSKASYDLTINGFDAGIQIFADAESQATWVHASDSLGGVCVVIDGAALSLNSSEGVADSAKLAPRIAEQVGGEAHGN